MSANDQGENVIPTGTNADASIQNLPVQDGSSDGEGGEPSARAKLKKTSIAGLSQRSNEEKVAGEHPLGQVVNASAIPDAQPENGQARGRPSKKRSFDDLQQNEETGASIENGGRPLPKKGAQHKRMRSRELSGDDEEPQSLDQNERMTSPVQEEDGADARQSPGGPGVLVAAPSQAEMDAVVAREKKDTAGSETTTSAEKSLEGTNTEAKSSNEQEQPESTVPASSGFANASTASPFSSFKSPKSPDKSAESAALSSGAATSTSAFASSGLSAFASSEKSPFGAAGSTAKSSGGFGASSSSGGFGSSSGGFGSGSSFASKPASGFGSGGGFGSAGGFGGGGGFGAAAKPFGGAGLSSFAGSAAGTSAFAKAKPFSVAKNDEDENGSENGGDEDEAVQQAEADAQQDPRFHQQELNTGEEDEKTIFSCTAKLYHFDKEWKESGVGDFRINIRYEPRSTDAETGAEDKLAAKSNIEDDEEDVEAGDSGSFNGLERRARLIMRARGTHRLVLNTPVFKEMNIGTHDGQEPTGKTMHITGLEDGKPTGYQMKVGKEETLKEIYHKIKELQDEL